MIPNVATEPPSLMKCPKEKAVGYTVIVVVCAIVVSIVIGMVGAAVAGVGALTTAGVSGGAIGSGGATGMTASDTDADDPAAETAAALESLGALLGGGERVEPVDIELLSPWCPKRSLACVAPAATPRRRGSA